MELVSVKVRCGGVAEVNTWQTAAVDSAVQLLHRTSETMAATETSETMAATDRPQAVVLFSCQGGEEKWLNVQQ